MKNLELESPLIIEKDKFSSIVELSLIFRDDFMNILGLKYPLRGRVLEMNNNSYTVKHHSPSMGLLYLLSTEIAEETTHMEIKLGICARLGEMVYQDLINLNNLYINHYFTMDDIKNEEREYYNLDYEGHRNIFGYLLKKGIYGGTHIILSNYELKNITCTFDRFIKDRNIYTHCKLAYCPSLEIFLIKYKEERNEYWAEINDAILQSYINVYKNLSMIIQTLTKSYKKS